MRELSLGWNREWHLVFLRVPPCTLWFKPLVLSLTSTARPQRTQGCTGNSVLTGCRAEPHNPRVTEPTFSQQQLRTPVLRRSFRKPYPVAVRGEGVYVWDSDGNRYLDFSGSAAVNFIGHGVREISDAMAKQARQLEFVHTSQFTTPVAEEFAAELLEFAGPNFAGGAVYFTSGGSESVETALKLARQYQVEIGETKRHQILSRQQSYHGSTLGRARGFRQQEAARDLFADGARVRTYRHSLLLSLRVRLHRQLLQLRTAIRSGVGARDRGGSGRGGGIHL